ncbi:hypothetical protein AGMMS49938_14440 [Fibrobacterales bacterium]|nr:hypothetical protein AGMMS49938_14440 [Fibrobacterales bacterium]
MNNISDKDTKISVIFNGKEIFMDLREILNINKIFLSLTDEEIYDIYSKKRNLKINFEVSRCKINPTPPLPSNIIREFPSDDRAD